MLNITGHMNYAKYVQNVIDILTRMIMILALKSKRISTLDR
jgi:acyl-ACP thioesterase